MIHREWSFCVSRNLDNWHNPALNPNRRAARETAPLGPWLSSTTAFRILLSGVPRPSPPGFRLEQFAPQPTFALRCARQAQHTKAALSWAVITMCGGKHNRLDSSGRVWQESMSRTGPEVDMRSTPIERCKSETAGRKSFSHPSCSSRPFALFPIFRALQ